jgi:hypothetical protein
LHAGTTPARRFDADGPNAGGPKVRRPITPGEVGVVSALPELHRKASVLAERAEATLTRRIRTRGYAALAEKIRPATGHRRIYFYHLRKTGGTSLVRSFLALGGEDPETVHWRMKRPPHATTSGGFVFVGADRRLIERGDYYFGWSHAAAWWLAVPPDTFRITVLRDPLQRMVSLYRYLADPRADAGQPFPAPSVQRAWAADGFSTFLDRLPRRDLLVQLGSFSESFDVEEAAGRIAACEAVIMTPDLDRATARLGSQLGVELEARRERSSVSRLELTEADLSRLREVLEPEYRLMTRLVERGVIPAGG